jgi:hypothetical protein
VAPCYVTRVVLLEVLTSQPPAIPAPRDGWADALAEAQEVRELTPQQRYDLLASACEAVFAILENHPRREEILAYQEPPAADVRALIDRARHVRAP